MTNAPRPVKVIGAMRRLENVVATKPFQDAAQNLIDDLQELKAAEKDPRGYLTSFGVSIPETAEVQIRSEKAAEESGAPRAMVTIVICVTWCTDDGCYTFCIRIPIKL